MIRLYERNNDPRQIERIVRLLNDGGVVIYPTDSTYALGCHALKERAVQRICRIKHIDAKSHPLSIICYNLSNISSYAHISTPTFKLMKRNLPGPFTFVLPGLNKLPKIFHGRPQHEIGIRMPEQPIVQEILAVLDAPLLTASLPMDGLEPEYSTDPELVDEQFGALVDLVIDGGIGRQELSTIVNCIDSDPVIERQGAGILK